LLFILVLLSHQSQFIAIAIVTVIFNFIFIFNFFEFFGGNAISAIPKFSKARS
jgi:hypothetical protein